MKTIHARTWEGVKRSLHSIAAVQASLTTNGQPSTVSQLLYRGQNNADWSLQSTLERVIENPMSLPEYYQKVMASRPQVEAFSELRWDLIPYDQYRKWSETAERVFLSDFPGYEYMIYLRHHGFPSPLLDWTRSPYIAAYFAFANTSGKTRRVAIFCYLEYAGDGKMSSSQRPHITQRGQYARSHRRHFLQQSQYTVCTRSDQGGLYYASHEDAFYPDQRNQDLLWKITAPASVAMEALSELDMMNINALSLFASEEALVETIKFQEFLRKSPLASR